MTLIIVEGKCEKAVIDILLDNERLIFSRQDLLFESCIVGLNTKKLETQYLSMLDVEDLTAYRILDSKKDEFKLSKEYKFKIKEHYDCVTSPEIEMLIIINENLWEEYQKVKKSEKPSVFLKKQKKLKYKKTDKFYKDYFYDVETLVQAIKEYSRINDRPKGKLHIADILRED